MATPATSVRTADHRYYYAVAAGLLFVVFVGFSRSYYLKWLFFKEDLPLLVHVHGAVMTAWYALFAVQVRLVATHRVALHRKLGVAGIVLSAAVAVLGTRVSIGLAQRRLIANPKSELGPFLLSFQLFAIVLVFIVMISLALYWRRRGDFHKRCMTLAMLSTLGPAVVRWPGIDDHSIPVAIAIMIALIILCIVADTVRNRRLHPVFGWGGAYVIGSIFMAAGLGQTAAWMGFVRRMLI